MMRSFTLRSMILLIIILEAAFVSGQFAIEPVELHLEVKEDGIVDFMITITSQRPGAQSFSIQTIGDGAALIDILEEEFTVMDGESYPVPIRILGNNATGTYGAIIIVSGDIDTSVETNITIVPRGFKPINALLIEIVEPNKRIFRGKQLQYGIDFNKLLNDIPLNVSFKSILELENNSFLTLHEGEVVVDRSFTRLFETELPEDISLGKTVLRVRAEYLEYETSVSTNLLIEEVLYNRRFFDIPLWQYAMGSVLIGIAVALWIWYRKNKESKKRFHAKTDTKALPKPGPRSLYTGKIAETNTKAYLDMDTLTVHTIIAGSTGGGKTIAAQDLIEEALDKNISIAVFDPTAQWTGMLRPLKDKKMLSYYPQFDLNKKQAKAYPGNITQITNPYTKINLIPKLQPGHIQIYTMNTLDPKDIDTFVANTVREIFHQNLKEQRQLTTLLVYDEVHRLLPKFGGSGEGFIQIERACREFRKWGLGVVLVSQVLADFVGQIKANINTEIQMKTRDEGDLERIKTKFGAEYVQSLVKAPVGSGMIQNSQYNHGKPYYITFRPIKHSVQRLTDEELEQYTKYNTLTEQLEYELEQLKQKNVDTFDTQLELNLAKQKIQQGQFNIAQIYTETITQNNTKHFKELGTTPQTKKEETIDKTEIAEEMKKAQEEHAKAEAETKKAEVHEEESAKETPLFKKTLGLSHALTFSNGQTAMSLEELIDIIKSMSPHVFIQHHNDKKNDTADWVEKEFHRQELGEALRKGTSRKDTVMTLSEWQKKGLTVKEEAIQPSKETTTDPQQVESASGIPEKHRPPEKQQSPEKQQPSEAETEQERPAKPVLDRFEELAQYMEFKIKHGEKEEAKKVYVDLKRCYHQLTHEEKKKVMQEGLNIFELLKAIA